MYLFHTSTQIIEHPDVAFSRDYLDFGKGFYLTSMREQAVEYGVRFKLRGKYSILNEFVFPDEYIENYKTKIFTHYNEEWLDFVAKCRRGEDDSVWDIVIGPIADDKVFRTIDLYFSGEMGKEEALRRLNPLKPNNQWCIRNQNVIEQRLLFIKSEQL